VGNASDVVSAFMVVSMATSRHGDNADKAGKPRKESGTLAARSPWHQRMKQIFFVIALKETALLFRHISKDTLAVASSVRIDRRGDQRKLPTRGRWPTLADCRGTFPPLMAIFPDNLCALTHESIHVKY
jgi:hypothetical protein